MAETTGISWCDHRKRFEKHFVKGLPDECWLWNGACLKSGYGVFGKPGGGIITAHRLAYIFEHGDIAAKLVVDHLCRNRQCVNPAHLEAVTNQENSRRGLKGSLPLTCANGHPWTEANTGKACTGRRFCRECRRIRDRGRARDAAYWRAYREKRKASG